MQGWENRPFDGLYPLRLSVSINHTYDNTSSTCATGRKRRMCIAGEKGTTAGDQSATIRLVPSKGIVLAEVEPKKLGKGGCADTYGDLSSLILSLGDLLLPASTEEMQCFQTGLTYIINTHQNIKIVLKLIKAVQNQVSGCQFSLHLIRHFKIHQLLEYSDTSLIPILRINLYLCPINGFSFIV